MVSINAIFDNTKMWTSDMDKKIILLFAGNPHFHPQGTKIYVGNNKIL